MRSWEIHRQSVVGQVIGGQVIGLCAVVGFGGRLSSAASNISARAERGRREQSAGCVHLPATTWLVGGERRKSDSGNNSQQRQQQQVKPDTQRVHLCVGIGNSVAQTTWQSDEDCTSICRRVLYLSSRFCSLESSGELSEGGARRERRELKCFQAFHIFQLSFFRLFLGGYLLCCCCCVHWSIEHRKSSGHSRQVIFIRI